MGKFKEIFEEKLNEGSMVHPTKPYLKVAVTLDALKQLVPKEVENWINKNKNIIDLRNSHIGENEIDIKIDSHLMTISRLEELYKLKNSIKEIPIEGYTIRLMKK